MLQAACEEHIRIRNEQGERIDSLMNKLKELACYAATARDENTDEWIQELAKRLNAVAEMVNEPTAFVWHKTYGGEMWITAKAIP